MTLTGTGGTGKTRLAVAVAADLEQRLCQEMYFVALHSADRAAVMWSGISEAVGAPGDTDQLPDERVLRFFADRVALLVLDNLEQIADADLVVSRLLDEAPALRILATSRRPLHLVDEHQYPVLPLPVPDPDADLAAMQAGAVDLFVRRARMVKPGFALTAKNARDVSTLCRRLDGLPLAIELAAARSRLLSPRALLQRIDDRMADEASITHRAQRQRTLRATISWSYDLLADGDQRVFAQLGVFSSRFDLDAVAQVGGADGRDPLDVVAHLIDVSLLEIVEGPDGEPMLFMLETIRRFARERLSHSDESDNVHLAHARWCHQVAHQICGLLQGPRQMSALDRMKAVEEDIRAALDWCLSPSASPTGERAACGFALLEPMDVYLYRFGYIAEGRGLARTVPCACSPTPTFPTVCKSSMPCTATGSSRSSSWISPPARRHWRRPWPWHTDSATSTGRPANRTASGSPGARPATCMPPASSSSRACRSPDRSGTAAGRRPRSPTSCTCIWTPATIPLRWKRPGGRSRLTGPSTTRGAWPSISATWWLPCSTPKALQRAHDELRTVIADAIALDDIELSIDAIDTSAAIWAGLGDAQRAARLLGTAQRQREVTGIPRAEPDQKLLDRFIEPVRQSTDPHTWTEALRRGASLSIEEAVAEATSSRSGSIPEMRHPVTTSVKTAQSRQ